jgi:hypothetical protein
MKLQAAALVVGQVVAAGGQAVGRIMLPVAWVDSSQKSRGGGIASPAFW